MKVTGSLQEKRGIYQMMARVTDEAGNVHQKQKSTKIRSEGRNSRETRANRLAAERMLVTYLHELSLDSGAFDPLFLTKLEQWLEKKRKGLRKDTSEAYRAVFDRHIEPYFHVLNPRITEITPKVIAKYVDDKLEEGLSANSIRKHLVIFNGMYKELLRYGEVKDNPCTNISVKDERDDFAGSAYTPETAKRLLQTVSGDSVETAVYLGLYLGLRRSEVAGLRWKDVDFEHNIVHIRNTVVRYATISEEERTKNTTSKRDLYLPEGLKRYLEGLPREDPDEHLCKLRPDYISHRFAKVLERSGLPKIRFHDLRHTAGSMLLNNGNSILQVQNFLGHKKASTTLDIYSHIYLEGKKATASKLDELLSD